MPAKNLKEINQTDVADLLGVSRARVSQIFKEVDCPIIKSGKKGKAVVVKSSQFFQWYIDRHLSKQLAKIRVDEDGIGTKEQEEKRLIAAKARKVEMELQILKEQLVPVMDVQILLDEVAINYVSGLEALPGRMANLIAGMNDPAEIKERIFGEVRRVRKSTAEKLTGFRAGGKNGEAVSENSGRPSSKNSK